VHGIITILLSTLRVAFYLLSCALLDLNSFAQAGYLVIPFVPGYDDIAGKILKLDHIIDQNLCPLDNLLRDHFLQGVLKNMGLRGCPW